MWQANFNLGNIYRDLNKVDDAIACYSRALEIEPHHPELNLNLGLAMAKQGKYDKSIEHFNEVLRVEPNWFAVYNHLGQSYARLGMYKPAIENYKKALQLNPEFIEAINNLAEALEKQGKVNEAIENWEKSLQLSPDQLNVRYKVGLAAAGQGRYTKAIEHFKRILQVSPGSIGALNALAWILATAEDAKIRNPNYSVELAERACELSDYKQPGILDTLAAAYAAAGEFSEAVTTAEKALDLASSAEQEEQADEIERRLHLYKAGQPYLESSP